MPFIVIIIVECVRVDAAAVRKLCPKVNIVGPDKAELDGVVLAEKPGAVCQIRFQWIDPTRQGKGLKIVKIAAVKERMLYDITRFEVKAGQPVKLEFVNPDATPHNLVIVKPGTGDSVGLAATRMAADPVQAKSGQYIPKTDNVLFHTKMVPPIAGETLRFMAPKAPGNYPYICTFPGHWTIMKGVMVVK